MREKFQKIFQETAVKNKTDEVLSYYEYLDLCASKPWVTRDTFQLLHDMILSSGVEHSLSPGKPVKHRYGFFEDTKKVGPFIVFGQQKAKENLVEKIDNASRGLESSKRLWILLGPPGSAKSRSMDGIKTALHEYSKSPEGLTYTILLPTVDERLRDRALFEENGVMYIQSPVFERPLQVIPDYARKEICQTLNDAVDQKVMQQFLNQHPHYDNQYQIQVRGLISPYSKYVLDDFMKTKNLDFVGLMDFLKVKRMVFDARTKTGVGSYTPRDEKSQEAGSLVGNIDYSLLPRFGSESHPLVHDYKGELCAGANGFVEIHEILKLSDKFLYEMLFATQDRFFKPEGQPPQKKSNQEAPS